MFYRGSKFLISRKKMLHHGSKFIKMFGKLIQSRKHLPPTQTFVGVRHARVPAPVRWGAKGTSTGKARKHWHMTEAYQN